jgi:hypothetical protein
MGNKHFTKINGSIWATGLVEPTEEQPIITFCDKYCGRKINNKISETTCPICVEIDKYYIQQSNECQNFDMDISKKKCISCNKLELLQKINLCKACIKLEEYRKESLAKYVTPQFKNLCIICIECGKNTNNHEHKICNDCNNAPI